MLKRMCALVVLVVCVLAVPSWAALYSYSGAGPLNLTDGSWTVEKSGNYFDILYSTTLVDKQITFANKYGGESHTNRGAIVWEAPEGEVITHVGFYWNRQGYCPEFNAALFDMSDDADLATADVLWSTGGAYTTGADGGLNYYSDVSDNLTGVGLGFYDTLSTLYHSAMFNSIAITTTAVPEPVSLVLMGLGGLLLRKRS